MLFYSLIEVQNDHDMSWTKLISLDSLALDYDINPSLNRNRQTVTNPSHDTINESHD